MRILKKIIDGLKADDNCKYSVNINLLLKSFLDYEVDIPDDYYEKYMKKGLIGSAIHQMKSLEGIEILEEGNSYNLAGRISHDFYYMMAKDRNSFYIAIQVNCHSEVRCHSYDTMQNNSYTDAFLLKFEDYRDFYDLVDEVVTENATFDIEVDGKIYLVTPQIQSEFLQVKCMDGDEDITGIYAANDEEFVWQIREYNNCRKESIKKLILGLKNRIYSK